MIPAQRDTAGPCCQNAPNVIGQRAWKCWDIGVIKGQIAIIDDIELFQRAETVPSIGRVKHLQCASLAQRPWPQTRTRTVGDRLIERYTGDRQINPLQILAVAPPQKRQSSAKAVLIAQATRALICKSLIYLIF